MNAILKEQKSLIVVGDKFTCFGSIPGAITASKLARIMEGYDKETPMPKVVVFGQGLSESWIEFFKSTNVENNLKIVFIEDKTSPVRAGRSQAHKVNRKNVLISSPSEVGENQFSMQLRLDDDCEIMADHTTGHHIQGMVLIEAARQSFLAVTEKFYLSKDKSYYFVINNMDVNYKKFAFPIETKINFDITSVKSIKDERFSATTDIDFIQNGESICTVNVKYTAILNENLSKKERDMAEESLKFALESQGLNPQLTPCLSEAV
ncbi:AfsA-related hotdog domain-containing protein [Neptuniibacter sp. QD34_54]|uniref:AfsA-related hotdog domain-containing protein n=1 Tax=Neptuniibacter sp. QD34_54 TaxID=3398208 RepID=UPI0039F5D775